MVAHPGCGIIIRTDSCEPDVSHHAGTADIKDVMSTRWILMAGVLAGFAAFAPAAKAQYWTTTQSPITNWGPIACSADGSTVVAAIGASRTYPLAIGTIYISSN